jgi:hypothetical protein
MLKFKKEAETFFLLGDSEEILVTSTSLAVLFSIVEGAGSVLLKIGDEQLTRDHYKRFSNAFRTSGFVKEVESLRFLVLPRNIDEETVNKLLDITGFLDVFLDTNSIPILGWTLTKLQHQYVWKKDQKLSAIYQELAV